MVTEKGRHREPFSLNKTTGGGGKAPSRGQRKKKTVEGGEKERGGARRTTPLRKTIFWLDCLTIDLGNLNPEGEGRTKEEWEKNTRERFHLACFLTSR